MFLLTGFSWPGGLWTLGEGIDKSLGLVRKIKSRNRNFFRDLEKGTFSFLLLLSIFEIFKNVFYKENSLSLLNLL